MRHVASGQPGVWCDTREATAIPGNRKRVSWTRKVVAATGLGERQQGLLESCRALARAPPLCLRATAWSIRYLLRYTQLDYCSEHSLKWSD